MGGPQGVQVTCECTRCGQTSPVVYPLITTQVGNCKIMGIDPHHVPEGWLATHDDDPYYREWACPSCVSKLDDREKGDYHDWL